MNKKMLLILLLAIFLFGCKFAYILTSTPEPTPSQTPVKTPTRTPMGVCMPNCGEHAETVCYGECPPDCFQCATHTPEIVCTPPACAEDEVYYCEDRCPGGCGTTCVTKTPMPTWWKPEPGLTFHIQYTGDIDLDQPVDVYNVDMFDTSRETIAQLHERGVKVICYFSAGTWEDWRFDADMFPEEIIGKPLEDWPGEKWLDISNTIQIFDIIERRMDIAANIGCDGVDPDNVDGYTNDTGFDLTEQDQLLFNALLAMEAHQRGLAIGLKNDNSQGPELVEAFDFAINEECFTYQECGYLSNFVDANKAVFVIEYGNDAGEYCAIANAAGYMLVRKNLDLDAWAVPCWQE